MRWFSIIVQPFNLLHRWNKHSVQKSSGWSFSIFFKICRQHKLFELIRHVRSLHFLACSRFDLFKNCKHSYKPPGDGAICRKRSVERFVEWHSDKRQNPSSNVFNQTFWFSDEVMRAIIVFLVSKHHIISQHNNKAVFNKALLERRIYRFGKARRTGWLGRASWRPFRTWKNLSVSFSSLRPDEVVNERWPGRSAGVWFSIKRGSWEENVALSSC